MSKISNLFKSVRFEKKILDTHFPSTIFWLFERIQTKKKILREMFKMSKYAENTFWTKWRGNWFGPLHFIGTKKMCILRTRDFDISGLRYNSGTYSRSETYQKTREKFIFTCVESIHISKSHFEKRRDLPNFHVESYHGKILLFSNIARKYLFCKTFVVFFEKKKSLPRPRNPLPRPRPRNRPLYPNPRPRLELYCLNGYDSFVFSLKDQRYWSTYQRKN